MYLVWMTATSFIRCADCYPLNREFDWWCGDQSLPYYTVGGSVNWYIHYGEQYGGSIEN